MKAIETEYKGYRFRSRLEARWAVFFDAMEWIWEYEKEGYSFDGGCYLPDFYLPKEACWIEIKGSPKLDDSVLSPLETFVKEMNSPLLVLCGLAPLYATYSIYPIVNDGRHTTLAIHCDKKHKDAEGLASHLVAFLMASRALKGLKNGEVYTGHCTCGRAECEAPKTWDEAFIVATTQHIVPGDAPNWLRATLKARGARFEYGEKG